MKIRQLSWGYKEGSVDPGDYEFEPEERILGFLRKETSDLLEISINEFIDLLPASKKQFTIDQIRQLVVGRGFLEVMCNWLSPEDIQDEALRGRVAIVQHLLEGMWTAINTKIDA